MNKVPIARSACMYALQLIAKSILSRMVEALSRTCALSFEILWYYTNASSTSATQPTQYDLGQDPICFERISKTNRKENGNLQGEPRVESHCEMSQDPTYWSRLLLFSRTTSAAVSFSPLTAAPWPTSSSTPSWPSSALLRSCSSSLIRMRSSSVSSGL
jgi:hypothetical protein